MMDFPLTVSSQWLVDHLQDRDVRIVDCRFALVDMNLGRRQYLEGHIPGAAYLDLAQDLSGPVQPHGGRHPLPNPMHLAARLSSIGVTSEVLVVAYDDSRFAFAARLWWLLRYLGHDRVAILEGGFSAYQAAGHPVTSVISQYLPSGFDVQLRPDRVVDINVIATRDESTILIDSRASDRYRGEREPIDPIAGHIPGAVNYFWQQVTNLQGELLSPNALQAYWSEIDLEQSIIVYCGSGVTACVNLLALEAIGMTTAKLYVGGWSDWCSYPLDSGGYARLP